MKIVMKLFPYLLAGFFLFRLSAQKTIEETLEKYNRGTVPYITVSQLATSENAILLDSRSREEFQVSHLENAIWVGYEEFDPARVAARVPGKETPLVVYCSVGVRSEDIGEKLMAAGYTHVRNLYGGIFQWKKLGHPVYDSLGKETGRVHAYNKIWGRLLTNAEPVY